MMIVKTPIKKKLRPNGSKSAPKNRSRKNGNGTASVDNKRRKIVSNGRRKPDKGAKKISLPKVKPWKVILGAIVIGALGILYLGHVFATQELLREVQQLEQQYNDVRTAHSDARLTYDRLIGPAEIYKKAKERGFINGGPADRVIVIEKQ